MKKLLKFVTLIAGLRFLVKVLSENVDIKVQIEKLRDELATLETKDLESKLILRATSASFFLFSFSSLISDNLKFMLFSKVL